MFVSLISLRFLWFLIISCSLPRSSVFPSVFESAVDLVVVVEVVEVKVCRYACQKRRDIDAEVVVVCLYPNADYAEILNLQGLEFL